MNRSSLISAIKNGLSDDNKTTRQLIDDILTAYEIAIDKELKNNGKIKFFKFGTLKIILRKARTSRNPNTKELINIPAKHTAILKTANKYKDEINAVIN